MLSKNLCEFQWFQPLVLLKYIYGTCVYCTIWYGTYRTWSYELRGNDILQKPQKMVFSFVQLHIQFPLQIGLIYKKQTYKRMQPAFIKNICSSFKTAQTASFFQFLINDMKQLCFRSVTACGKNSLCKLTNNLPII